MKQQITETEQKYLIALDEIELNKSFISALIAENDSQLNSNKRLFKANEKLRLEVEKQKLEIEKLKQEIESLKTPD